MSYWWQWSGHLLYSFQTCPAWNLQIWAAQWMCKCTCISARLLPIGNLRRGGFLLTKQVGPPTPLHKRGGVEQRMRKYWDRGVVTKSQIISLNFLHCQFNCCPVRFSSTQNFCWYQRKGGMKVNRIVPLNFLEIRPLTFSNLVFRKTDWKILRILHIFQGF